MGAVSYKGYVANVVNAREALDFRSRSAAAVMKDFRELIDRYLADCESEGVAPTRPCSAEQARGLAGGRPLRSPVPLVRVHADSATRTFTTRYGS